MVSVLIITFSVIGAYEVPAKVYIPSTSQPASHPPIQPTSVYMYEHTCERACLTVSDRPTPTSLAVINILTEAQGHRFVIDNRNIIIVKY